MTHYFRIIFITFLLAMSGGQLCAESAIVIDSAHYSEVLGERRQFRIYLPPDYNEATDMAYPVVYFYHGWSQRYFGSLNRRNSEQSEPTEEMLISRVTEKYKIIVVKPDGYNADPDEPYYLRPYNISPVETHRQFALYFPELVDFIDHNFRTLRDRQNRGVTGYSMGGFMSFWLAGKYPHLISAAGSFCGSPEFFVGPKDYPVEYAHADMHGNYQGVRLRLNYGEEDFIRAYHHDLDAIFSRIMDHYEVGVYPGGHALSGFEDMFEFFNRSFQQPLPVPDQWNHIDVYPTFEVWGYQVTSDRDIPGFTVLENVSPQGFRSAIRPFLPEGRPMNQFGLVVRTAPIYHKNTDYLITLYDHSQAELVRTTLRSDAEGRLKIALSGGQWDVSIVESGKEDAFPVVQSMNFVSGDWPIGGQSGTVQFDILNMGNQKLEDAQLRVRLFNEKGGPWIEKPMERIPIEGQKSTQVTLDFSESEELLSMDRIDVEIVDGSGQIWKSSEFLPVLAEKELTLPFEIADGRSLTWLSQARDTVTSVLGIGNGDGIANPGETILIVVRDGEIYRLGQWYTSNPYIDLTSPGSRQSDNWTPFDHVGGSFKYHMPTIPSDIPTGEEVSVFVQYWIPDYPDHFIKGGRINISVKGEDTTPPICIRATISNDNILRVLVRDGGKVREVVATLTSEDKTTDKIVCKLSDAGSGVDRVLGDHIFSGRIDVPHFGEYSIKLQMKDEFGNTENQELEDTYILYGQQLR